MAGYYLQLDTSPRLSAFEELKQALSRAPVLAQTGIQNAKNGTKPFYIYSDASKVGVGAVLAQKGDDGYIHPVYFTSKRLTKAEENYHITDLEALALMHAFRKFHYFIFEVRTVVRTDHQALASLFKRANVSPRVLRWALEIQRYDISIEYVKGAANSVADALSRGIPQLEGNALPTWTKNEGVIGAIQSTKWLEMLRRDSEFQPAIEAVEKGTSMEIRLARNRTLLTSDFTIDNGQLKLILEDGETATVVPEACRKDVFQEHHNGTLGGHFNARKTFKLLQRRVFWPGMLQDLTKRCRECQKCFLVNNHRKNTPPLRPVSARPFQVTGVDVLEMGPTTKGNKY
ncbi:hypothetical protein Y032_0086g1939 [Ancylostoma ceylanicum]|uniref:RNA-directed DNA polymerase n=1 Tax=Ancylostoma ceylanicum TaxID=53326 RepID=A0A016TQH9_9BILA|nr:hypothetical protein Y032_0086g1939 [Ancylostoma ceylanicum]